MLEDIIKQLGNPEGKLYNIETGTVAFPCGGDAGEVYYLCIYFDMISRKWRPQTRSAPLPEGYWRPCVGVDESELVKIAERRWKETV